MDTGRDANLDRLDGDDLDAKIGLARIVLSIAATVSVWVDPTVPDLAPWGTLRGGLFAIDRFALATLVLHTVYAGALYRRATVGGRRAQGISSATSLLDVAFAAVITVLTEGVTSPGYVFFAFAIIAVACRRGFRATLVVTVASALLYWVLILVSIGGGSARYAMRPFYLGVIGSLIGFLGQKRVDFEARILHLEAEAERRRIARSLHDGYVQALGGVNLRLETCRELARRGESERILGELAELQVGVAREYDEVRRYVRMLAREDEGRSLREGWNEETRLVLSADLAATASRMEEVLQLLLEGVRNIIHHARAGSGALSVASGDDGVRITIADDGIGFAEGADLPWAIASRVRELGGRLRLASSEGEGARLEIEMPHEERA